MNKALTSVLTAAALLAISASCAMAAPVAINTADPSNGIYDIYSATFDGALIPCSGGSPPQCPFFGGDAPAPRALAISPNPTGVNNQVPGGIAGPPASGSYLDLTLSGGNSLLTLAGGTISLPAITITIAGSTVVTASGAGWVFDPAPVTTAVSGGGLAIFQVDLAPLNAGDFSTLGAVVTSCSGPLCALLGVLSLDMVRYQLAVQYDPTFSWFTSTFEGQTGNNSLVFANLNSVPVPAAAWLFGSALGLLGVARRRFA